MLSKTEMTHAQVINARDVISINYLANKVLTL